MTRLSSRAVLHGLLEILDDPAPINPGHASYIRGLVREALERISGHGGPLPRWSGGWAGHHPGELAAAVLPDDLCATDPGI